MNTARVTLSWNLDEAEDLADAIYAAAHDHRGRVVDALMERTARNMWHQLSELESETAYGLRPTDE